MFRVCMLQNPTQKGDERYMAKKCTRCGEIYKDGTEECSKCSCKLLINYDPKQGNVEEEPGVSAFLCVVSFLLPLIGIGIGASKRKKGNKKIGNFYWNLAGASIIIDIIITALKTSGTF